MARILVIDDDEVLREAMSRKLTSQGHVVVQAEDGAEGIARIAEHVPDLVITDVFMPGRDGIETLLEIRKAFRSLKVIVMSGGDSSGLINLLDDAELLGAAFTLPKPFTPEELLAAVESLLPR
jgi:two-component system chemotaxis response regulator CheY